MLGNQGTRDNHFMEAKLQVKKEWSGFKRTKREPAPSVLIKWKQAREELYYKCCFIEQKRCGWCVTQ